MMRSVDSAGGMICTRVRRLDLNSGLLEREHRLFCLFGHFVSSSSQSSQFLWSLCTSL